MKIEKINTTRFNARIQFKNNEPEKNGNTKSQSAQSMVCVKRAGLALAFLPVILMKIYKIKKSVKLPS